MPAVPKSVQQAVAPSAGNTVRILTGPQLGPYKPMSGHAIVPAVPRTQVDGEGQILGQPGFGGYASSGVQLDAGGYAAPSVDTDGFLWTAGPIDSHYTGEREVKDSTGKMNNPPTRGMQTRTQAYQNHIALASQDVDPNGFRIEPDQQRTSYMRNTLPPHAGGYAPETYIPRQMPQRGNTYKYMPATGTQAYGTGVLNSDSYGAGQTAGGQGGNQYTPTPGPPDTVSTAGNQNVSSMPTWG